MKVQGYKLEERWCVSFDEVRLSNFDEIMNWLSSYTPDGYWAARADKTAIITFLDEKDYLLTLLRWE